MSDYAAGYNAGRHDGYGQAVAELLRILRTRMRSEDIVPLLPMVDELAAGKPPLDPRA